MPSPPTFRLWQGQQQRFKKDAQQLPLSPCLFQQCHGGRRSRTLPQAHVPAAPSFPPPPPCSWEHHVPLIHHSARSTPALCLCHQVFWLDFLAILITVHHRLARKSDFSTQIIFFFFFKKPSSRRMGDLELLRILLLIISTLTGSFPIHSYNHKQI